MEVRVIAQPWLLSQQRGGPEVVDSDHLADLEPAKDDMPIWAPIARAGWPHGGMDALNRRLRGRKHRLWRGEASPWFRAVG
jgi:hypothetical protein